MRRFVTLFTSVSMLVGTAGALSAQVRDRGLVELPPQPVRAGFYVTAGLGNGMEQYKYSDDPLGYTDWLSSPAVAVRVGGTPNASLRIGAELFGWWNSFYDGTAASHATDSFSAILLDGQFYPAPRSGFYVKGGVGIARSAESFDCCQTVSENGFGWSAGAGYDLPLSRNVAISPVVDFYQGSFAERGAPTITEHVLNIGVSLTFQAGRSRF